MAVVQQLDPAAPLLTFLRGVFGADVRYAELPASFGQGFDTLIYGFQIEGTGVRDVWARPLVLRVYTTASEDAKARAEAAIQRFVTERGYPALSPLALETSEGKLGLPFMIMERMPGGAMLERVAKRPWQAPRVFGDMGRLHAALHRLPTEGAPLASRGPSVDLHVEALRRTIAASHLTGLDDGLDWIVRHASAMRSEEERLVHGDFHPLNILLAADGSPRVIDWSDAGLGDRHADVARTATLISFGYIVASSSIERVLLKLMRHRLRRWYLDAYERAHALDRRRLAFWEAAQALRGTAQLMEVHTDPGADERNLAGRLPPELIGEAHAYFDGKARAFDALV